MAEIALVASIFGVAAFGTKVATSLYEAAEIMIHAHQQIASMAKHVSQFTAILRHLGRVLEAEKESCSDDLLREIRKIKRSCKITFKEIKSTFQSRKYRPFVPVRWLFRHSQARELEARLDSQRSMLQVMIQTVTVSNLGDMHSKSKEDSRQISGLREEIHILKNLIIENHNNLTELQHAEQCTVVENRRQNLPEAAIRQAIQLPNNQRGASPDRAELDGHGLPCQSSLSSHCESDDEDSNSDMMANSTRRTRTLSRDQYDLEQTRSNNRSADTTVGSTVQPLSAYNSTRGSGSHQASTLLLQMIPYRAGNLKTSIDRSDLLGPDKNAEAEIEPKPVMKEATQSVRLLLDKWTTLGSAPVSDVLAEVVSNSVVDDYSIKAPNGSPNNEYIRASDAQTLPRQPSRMVEPTNSDFNHRFHAPSEGCNIRGRVPLQGRFQMAPTPAWTPAFQSSNIRTAEVWKSIDTFGTTVSRYTGHSIMKRLRLANGGIVYMKRSELQQAIYLDDIEIYRFNLVPSSLLTPEESLILHTEIGKGWIRQEALDLLGYSYSETPSGNFSIPRNLYFNEITELVRLSYQGFIRGLEERSRKVIEDRNWRELVESMQELPLYPGEHRGYADTDGEWKSPWDQDLDSGWKYKSSDNADTETDEPLEDRNSFSLPHNASVPAVIGPSKDTAGTRPVAEKSFTHPRMDSSQHTQKTSTSQKPDNRIGERDVRTKSTSYNSINSDDNFQSLLRKHPFPYTTLQNKRSKGVRKKAETSAHAKKRGHVPPTVTEKTID